MPKDEKKFDLTIQQEADLAQSANEWINLLIEKKLVDPFKHAAIAAIISRAMRDTALGQMKEINTLRTSLKEAGEHLSKLTTHGVKLEANGTILSNHLSVANEIGDEAAKALDFLSRQECDCEDGSGPTGKHGEGCSVWIAAEALIAMRKLMEGIL